MGHAVGEVAVVLNGVYLTFALRRQQFGDDRADVLDRLDEEAQRAAVDLGALHVVEVEAVLAEELVQGGDGEVAQVLVVDGVELDVIDQIDNVGALDDGHAGRLQHGFDAGDEAVEVGHVGQDVVGQEDVGRLALVYQLRRQVAGEEGDHRRDARLAGGRGRGDRRVDAQHGDTPVGEVLQQVAVVAGGFHDQAIGAKRAGVDDVLGALAEVFEQRLGDRREVGVLGVEQNLRVDRLADLGQRRVWAEGQGQRRYQVRLVELVGAQQTVGQRRFAKGDDGFQVGRAGNAVAGFGRVD